MITSTSNSRVKHARRLQTDRRYRERESAFVIEGTRWLDEVVQWAHTPHFVFYTQAWRQKPEHDQILQQVAGPTLLVGEQVMAVMSDTETPAGVLAILPAIQLPLPPNPSLLLILDRVRDPGNLGTILRTAGAAGVDGVLLGPGTVDAYNPKVIRAGMGAHLRLPQAQVGWSEIESLTKDMAVWVATAAGAVPHSEVNWRRPAALIIGSEAHGVGQEAERLAKGKVFIPMHGATESLNAAIAAAVILFEAARQRRT
jgi:TrmH family RNA methyltransferase